MILRYLLPLAAAGLLAFAIFHVAKARPEEKPAPPVGEPPRSPYAVTVSGAGMLEPQTENISLGSPVSGIVTRVAVQVGAKVKPGEVLFQLDDRQLQAERKVRQAQLNSARAELERWTKQPRAESLPPAEAAVREAEAMLADQEDQLRRTRDLHSRKIATLDELNRRLQATEMVRAKLAKNEAELALLRAGAWQYDMNVAKAGIDLVQAQIDQTTTELDRLIVRAPEVAGKAELQVLQVNVRPGEFVGAAAGQTLILLGNVDQLHVRVDIDEHDIPRFQPQAPAVAMLKGDARESFPLEFVRLEPYVVPKRSLTGANTERVDTRVLQVIYALRAKDKRLFVGQQVDVFTNGAAGATAGKP